MISELERNLLSGLGITLNTAFEKHIDLISRTISKNNPSITYNPKHEHKMSLFEKWFRELLQKSNHPNITSLSDELLTTLQRYIEIRNILVHRDGVINNEETKVRKFVLANRDLFNLDESISKISIKPSYIRKVIVDQSRFFKIVLYTAKGDIVYW
ncbi:MAG: hypothetical protein AAB478_02895 [Patescibacteria group bacterium]